MHNSHERRFNPEHRAGLISDERQARWQPANLLTLAGLRTGHVALDLGSGPGFWTLPMAEIVGVQGKVIALDVSPEMLAALIEQEPPAHVRPMAAELPGIPLPDSSVDFIWSAFVFHEVEPPAALALEMRRVLRRDGCLNVLDWRTDAKSESGPPRHHRLSAQKVENFLRAAGFTSVQPAWQDDDTYLLRAA